MLIAATKVSKEYTTGEIAIRALNEVSFEIELAKQFELKETTGSDAHNIQQLISWHSRSPAATIPYPL